MAILRTSEIRKMPPDQRRKRLEELKTELMRLMATKAMGGALENPGRIREIKRTIARLITIMKEEEK